MELPKILIADSNLEHAKQLEDFLTRERFQAERVNTAKQALEKAALCDYDLIFMECGSKEMDGIELHNELKQKHPTKAAKIIFMSELHMEELKNIHRTTGRPAFKKPLYPDTIKKILPSL